MTKVKSLRSYCHGPTRVCSVSESCSQCDSEHKRRALELKEKARRD